MSSLNHTKRIFRLFAQLDGLGAAFFAAAAIKTGDRELSRARGELLIEIQAAGGRLQVQDLAERTGRTKSAAAELIAKLCREGYVFKMRVAGDGRGVWVVLSGKGRRAAAIHSLVAADLDRAIRGMVTEMDIRRLEKLVLRIEQSIKKGTRS
jgi:DNA-binding MarR family transcriptional regulator